MKRFVTKLLIYTLVLAVLVAFANTIYTVATKSEKEYLNKFNNIPDTLQICNFGSSHGYYGYNYEEIEDQYECFNFALESQSLSYDERLLAAFKEHIGQGTTVYVNISYFSFFGIAEEETADFEAKNKRYYSILPAEQIKDYSLKNKILYDLVPILGVEPGLMAEKLLGEDTDDNSVDWDADATGIDVKTNAKNACTRHLVNERLDENGNRIINSEEIQALYSIIEQCREVEATPILVTTPYLKEYTDEVSDRFPEFYDEFYSILDEVVEKTSVEYYDYAFDERFANRYDLFINADHLNRDGAREFVGILVSETLQ